MTAGLRREAAGSCDGDDGQRALESRRHCTAADGCARGGGRAGVPRDGPGGAARGGRPVPVGRRRGARRAKRGSAAGPRASAERGRREGVPGLTIKGGGAGQRGGGGWDAGGEGALPGEAWGAAGRADGPAAIWRQRLVPPAEDDGGGRGAAERPGDRRPADPGETRSAAGRWRRGARLRAGAGDRRAEGGTGPARRSGGVRESGASAAAGGGVRRGAEAA